MDASTLEFFDAIIQKFGYRRFGGDQQIEPSESLVRELESDIGFPIPVEYRSFLLRYGGIRPSVGTDVVAAQTGEVFSVTYFLAFFRPQPHPSYKQFDLLHSYLALRKNNHIKPGFLPFLDVEGSNILCLQLAGEQKGSIWAWMFEMFDEMEEHDFLFVAPDFLSLLRSFRATP